jgi:high-affinity iron transporter
VVELGAFVILLREGFEAALVVGLIVAFLARTGQLRRHGRAVWTGVAAAVASSAVAGAVLFAIFGELDQSAEAVFEGVAMLVACAVLTWMVFWMRRQARTIGGHLREQVGQAVTSGGGAALAAVAFVGVAREGLESALFLFVSFRDEGALETIAGGAAGLALAVGLGVAFYRGSVRLDLRRFFLVTGLLVIALGAYLLYGGLHELGEAGGGEALEVAGPVLAVLFAAGFGWLYLRDARAGVGSEREPAAESATR